MSVSLFRRWRSQRFSDLVGQESVVSTLQNVLGAGSPARAYLFCGPRGTGKTSSARIFAKALNCENGPTKEPCNECSQCVSISDGSNLDVFEIDAASHTQVEKIRDFIVEKVHFAPVSARYKVYIIDEVHKLSTSSFNALLKTLEEPPPHVVFVLATTHPHEMPPTILSRCQRYDFRPLTAGETESHLQMIAGTENISLDEDAARQLARAADGSLRDALVLFEQAIAFSDGRVTRDKVLDLLGGVGYEVLEEMFLDLQRGNASEALKRLDEWIRRGRDLKRLAESFQNHLRMMLLLKVRAEDQSIRHLSAEERESLNRICGVLPVPAITQWLKHVMEMLTRVREGRQARLEWEMMLVALALPETDSSLEGVQRRLERLEGGQGPGGLEHPQVDGRLMARLEALEAAQGSSEPVPDPRMAARLEALEQAIQRLENRPVPSAEGPSAPSEPPKEKPVAPPAPSEADKTTFVPAPRAESMTPTPIYPDPVFDSVEEWLEMPEPLVTGSVEREAVPPPVVSPAEAETVKLEVTPELKAAAPPQTERSLEEPPQATEEDPAVPEPVKPVSEPLAQEPPPEEPSVEAPPVVVETPPARVQEPPSAPPAEVEAAASLPEPKEFWRRLMQLVKEQDIRLHAVLADAKLTELNASIFHLALPAGYEWHFGKVKDGRTILESVAQRLTQRSLVMECSLGGEKAAPPKESEHDDLVQRAAGVFGGASIVE